MFHLHSLHIHTDSYNSLNHYSQSCICNCLHHSSALQPHIYLIRVVAFIIPSHSHGIEFDGTMSSTFAMHSCYLCVITFSQSNRLSKWAVQEV